MVACIPLINERPMVALAELLFMLYSVTATGLREAFLLMISCLIKLMFFFGSFVATVNKFSAFASVP